MKHIFKKGINSRTLLLLHGTGGDEHDLIPIAKMIDDEASVLSVRGNVLENGMPRFFKRLQEGIFDEEDLIMRTHELDNFISLASEKYGFNRNNVVAIGYSNGANIAGSILFHVKASLKGAILFHPMVPIRGIKLPNQTGTDVFIGASINDPFSSDEETKELGTLLSESNASVEYYWGQSGHRLTNDEIEAAKKWYRNYYN